MNQQEFDKVVKIIADDKKYRHFINSISRDFNNSKIKGIPVAMHIYFAKEGKEDVGFCILSLSPLKMRQWEKTFREEGWVDKDFSINISSFELMYLYIRPEFRRKGKATGLFNKMMKKSKDIGIQAIYAYVSDTDNAALRFYCQSGAKIINDFSDETDGLSAAYLVWNL